MPWIWRWASWRAVAVSGEPWHSPWSRGIVGRAVASLGHHCGCWDVVMGVRASMGASGHRCGRRDIAVGVVDSWCGQERPPAHPTSSWSVRGRRDVDRAVGTSSGPSGRHQNWTI